jgi:hypothetical protein
MGSVLAPAGGTGEGPPEGYSDGLLGMSASQAAQATGYGPVRAPVAGVVGRAVDIVAGTW